MGKKILIIEDDPDILEIMEIIFQEEGFEPILCHDGTSSGQVSVLHPDLILLDIRIVGSKKSGAQICYELKTSAETSHFPIILVSAENELPLIAHQCPADGYISKPFDIDQLLDKVKEFIY